MRDRTLLLVQMKNYLNTETPTISANVRKLFENGKKDDILKAIENERKSKTGIGIFNGIKVTRVGFN